MDVSDEISGDEPKTFHIYLLSFLYGFLIVLVLVHIVWRWQWRRTELSHLKSHCPGDKSFRCKSMRKRLRADFSDAQRLHTSPKARLVNPKYRPNQFGASSDGSSIPSHWYRMKVFDAAADFVSQNTHLVGNRGSDVPHQETSTMFLPTFVSLLRETGVLEMPLESGDTCCELYNRARYRDGVFTQSQWEEFRSLLAQLQARLHSDQREHVSIGTRTRAIGSDDLESVSSPRSEIVVGYGQHDPLQQTTSNDPLIFGSDIEQVLNPSPLQTTESTKASPGTASVSVTPSRLRGKKPTSIEMSPLVRDTDSANSSLAGTPHTGVQTTV